jgi:hypothetical protein
MCGSFYDVVTLYKFGDDFICEKCRTRYLIKKELMKIRFDEKLRAVKSLEEPKVRKRRVILKSTKRTL